MLLVEWTMGGVMHRISNEFLSLEHPWKAKIKSFNVHYKTAKEHGGYCQMSVGDIVLIPDFFSTDWPPPINVNITVKETTNNEASAVTLFKNNVAHWSGQERGSVRYTPYGCEHTATIASSKVWSTQTLNQIMSTLCSSSMLNLTYSSSMGRTWTSTAFVNYTMKSERLAIDFMNDLTAYFSHLFYIGNSSTLYLVDMFKNNSSRAVGFKFFPPKYKASKPIAATIASTKGTATALSTYTYGEEKNFDSMSTSAQLNSSAMTDILTTLNKRKLELTLPSTVSRILPGERLSETDTRFPNDLTAKINARDIHYDWGNKRVTVTGEGILTS